MKAGIEGRNNLCVVCEEAKVQHPCKLCKAYLYCSKGCCKRDTKKHKQSCSRLGLHLDRTSSNNPHEEVLPLLFRHLSYMAQRQDSRAESRESARSVLSAAGLAAKAEKSGREASAPVADTAAAAAAAVAACLAARKEFEEEKAKQMSARRELAGAREALAGAALQAKSIKSGSYGDSGYWEQRHAKSRESDETYEWYTGYPDEALRVAFPQAVRDKKTLVVGCGNSELSERMCGDGFRDVLSVDTSESAIEQMSARAARLNTAGTKCRYQVMDAGRLDSLGTGTFGGVVDKGTIDAVLSGGRLPPARRICEEAMRVLEPGGTFLVISSTPGEKLLKPLLAMCGPAADGGPPLPVTGGAVAGVHAYIVRKKKEKQQEKTGGGVDSTRGGRSEGSQRLEDSDQRGYPPAEASTARPTGGGPRHNPRISEAKLSCERPKPSSGDGGSEGPRRGEVGGEPPPPLPPPPSSKVLDWGSSREEQAKARLERMLNLYKSCRASAGAAAAAGPRLPQERRNGHPTPAGKAPVSSASQKEEVLRKLERQAPKTSEEEALKSGESPQARAGASARRPGGGVRAAPPPLAARKQQQQQPQQQRSLPWGSQETFTEDAAQATYELKFDTELSSSDLSVEIGAAHIKVSRRRPRPGGGDPEVLLDWELPDKVTAESSWCIEDRTVLSFNLYKRTPYVWKRAFKSDGPKPPSIVRRGGGTGDTKANGACADEEKPQRRELPTMATTGCRPRKPAPSPPAAPRMRERSPKVGLITARDFKAPERFLVEDHTGIRKLQLCISKPPGFRVAEFQVSRAGPELCEVRLVCRDTADSGSGGGLPDVKLFQRANVGREDFSTELASCAGEAADGVCVVRVPYGDAERAADVHGAEEDRAWEGCDADDEGVRHVARVRCRFCRHPFTPAGKSLAVRAMPSGRWDECIEDMICFDGPQAVPVLARDVNFARPGRCLMAQVEVLLHPRDVVRGAVRIGGGAPPPAVSGGGAGSDDASAGPGEGTGWRSLECARCDLPLGRLATVEDGHDSSGGGGCNIAEEDRGLLLLKHCVLGDDASGAGVGDNGGALGVNGGEENGRPAPPPQLPPHASPPTVFENRTAIKWVMGEMAYFSERDGCARFIVSARGRSPAAPGGSLTLVLAKMNSLISVRGADKPARAHRIKFREESRKEAERRDEEERGGEGSPPQDGATGGAEGGKGSSAVTAAKVPARLLEVSYGEYRAVRARLVGAAWASASSNSLDPRGYTYSYLF